MVLTMDISAAVQVQSSSWSYWRRRLPSMLQLLLVELQALLDHIRGVDSSCNPQSLTQTSSVATVCSLHSVQRTARELIMRLVPSHIDPI